MFTENINLLLKMSREKQDLYAIFSLLSDTIDAMRTDLASVKQEPGAEIYRFLEAMLIDLNSLDQVLNRSK